MAARRTDLVQADPVSSGHGAELATTDHSSFVPGLRGEEGRAPEQLDATQEIFSAGQSPEDILAEPPDARDIAAELSAPPRRKLPWLTLILAAGVIAAGSFWGGAMVQKNSGSSTSSTAAAFASRLKAGGAGGTAGGFGGFSRSGGTGTGTGSGSAAGSGSTTGTVKLIDGSTIYVTDSSGNIVKVTTGSSTSVSIASSGTVSQLQPGQTVTVRGATDSSGDLAATSVTEGASAAGSGGGFGGGGFGGGAG